MSSPEQRYESLREGLEVGVDIHFRLEGDRCEKVNPDHRVAAHDLSSAVRRIGIERGGDARKKMRRMEAEELTPSVSFFPIDGRTFAFTGLPAAGACCRRVHAASPLKHRRKRITAPVSLAFLFPKTMNG